MKKFFAVLTALILTASGVLALTDVTPAKGGSFYDGSTLQPQTDSATGTTVTTVYTPLYVGQLLIGKTDGSNSVWLARDLTTSGWSLVDGNGGDFAADDLQANCITEEKLKAVDAAADEDILSYESTTGDFEWHSAAELQAKFTEGSYTDSSVVSADIKDGEIVNADIKTNAAIVATKISGTAVTYVTAAQVDTNVTTVATGYTPAFVGQVLVGGAGTGTNAVWIAKGVTTNDWVAIKP